MKPLKLIVNAYGSDDEVEGNIRQSLSLGLPEFSPFPIRHDGTFVICGSGPSLPQFVEEIREERARNRPIVSINGAHDFLVENGIEPDLFVTVDPRPMPQNFKRVNDRTLYLLATRCSPQSFERLQGRKVMVFHSYSRENENRLATGRNLIAGGTTSGLRAISLGHALGFRNFILYGMDSCLAEDGKTKRFTGEEAPQVIDVIVGGRKFLCNAAMASQADEFQLIYKVDPTIHIESRGDGLISAIIRERIKQGLHA